jgi:FHS family L-fucose permease-like MFS transporter
MTRAKLTTKENLVPFILVTALFFLWGIAHGLLDVLNKHFQEILQISKARSGLIQFAMYTAYFTMALPAGLGHSSLRAQRRLSRFGYS